MVFRGNGKHAPLDRKKLGTQREQMLNAEKTAQLVIVTAWHTLRPTHWVDGRMTFVR